MSKNRSKICTVEFDSIEGSFPFEKRVLKFENGTVHVVGRVGKNLESPNLEATLLFETGILSRKHAKLFFKGGKLYLLDLNSSHGTYVNGKRIPTEGKDLNAEIWNACEVKTDDIVRFAASRKLCASGEVQAPIEGRLTITIASVEKKEKIVLEGKKEAHVEVALPCTPFDGYDQEKKEVQNLQVRESTSPKTPPGKCERKWSLLQPAETGQRGTLTEPIATTSNCSQTDIPKQTEGALHSYYGQWKETEREFSVYRRQTLKIIVLCLAIAVLYHLIANGLEMMLKANSKRHFKI